MQLHLLLYWYVKFYNPSFYFILNRLLKAIFLHSVDQNLSSTGLKSHIPYAKLFMQYKQIIVSSLAGQQEKWIGLMQWFNDHVFAWQDVKRADNSDGESSSVDEALKPGDDVGWDEISFIQNGIDCEGDSLPVQVTYIMLYHLNTGLTVIPRYYQMFLDHNDSEVVYHSKIVHRSKVVHRNKVVHQPMVARSCSDNLWTERNLLPLAANHPLSNLFQLCNLQLLSNITPPGHLKVCESIPTVIPVVKEPKQHLKHRHNLPKKQIRQRRARRRQCNHISMSPIISYLSFFCF